MFVSNPKRRDYWNWIGVIEIDVWVEGNNTHHYLLLFTYYFYFFFRFWKEKSQDKEKKKKNNIIFVELKCNNRVPMYTLVPLTL